MLIRKEDILKPKQSIVLSLIHLKRTDQQHLVKEKS